LLQDLGAKHQDSREFCSTELQNLNGFATRTVPGHLGLYWHYLAQNQKTCWRNCSLFTLIHRHLQLGALHIRAKIPTRLSTYLQYGRACTIRCKSKSSSHVSITNPEGVHDAWYATYWKILTLDVVVACHYQYCILLQCLWKWSQ